jgi:ABC-2 type transport system ATP-binding protein
VIIDHGRTVAAGTPAELKRQIAGSVIEVHARSRDDLSMLAQTLARLDHGEVRIDEATRRVSVAAASGGDELMSTLRAIQAARLQIADIALREPNLDEVFLALTGRSTESDDGRRAPERAAA